MFVGGSLESLLEYVSKLVPVLILAWYFGGLEKRVKSLERNRDSDG